MTGKERAALRAAANSLEPLFQVGKGGVTEAVIAQTETVYNTRELIKIKVLLETCPATPREVAGELAEKTGSDVIQVIGGVIVLYRINEELRKKAAEKRKKERQRIKEKAAQKAALEKSKKSRYRREGEGGFTARPSKPSFTRDARGKGVKKG